MNDLEEILKNNMAKLLAKQAKQAKAVKQAAARQKSSRMERIKQDKRQRQEEARQALAKSGEKRVEDFLNKIAPAFLNMMEREGAEDQLQDLTIVLRPGKSDASSSYCFMMERPKATARVWHKPTIQQMPDTSAHKIRQLQRELQKNGGLTAANLEEAYEEILRLRQELTTLREENKLLREDKATTKV